MNNNYDANIMTKFNELKLQYDHDMIKPNQPVFFSDETLKEEEIKNLAMSNEIISKYIAGNNIKKVIYVKNRLINIVL